jgi:hypothetical protein
MWAHPDPTSLSEEKTVKKSLLPLILIILLMVALLTGCGEKAGDTNTETAAQTEEQAAPAKNHNPNAWQGKVLETMDAGGYTYVHIDTGQEIVVAKSMPMKGFQSKTLDRTFDVIYFVAAIEDANHTHSEETAETGVSPKSTVPSGMGGMGGSSGHNTVDTADVKGVAKAAGGYTVEDIFTQSAQLGGQPVKVRGQVVKFTANIMGTNWAHIQDGTGAGPTGDLTVTTSDVVAVGDVVLVEGSLTLNKDFGAGYKYAAIIEGAKLTKE